MHYLEGLDQQLRILEDSEREWKTDSTVHIEATLSACANCFELENYCKCGERVYWPIQYVIIKLRWLLHHRMAG